MANVALPDIGRAFDSSQTALNLIAVGYSLGLAGSVLWFGALGDRYGRKLMIVLGMLLSLPACVLAAWAPSDGVLFAARLMGGFSAGMAYPTTLALGDGFLYTAYYRTASKEPYFEGLGDTWIAAAVKYREADLMAALEP